MENSHIEVRPASEKEKAVFLYLNALRKKGEIIMFAASPYIEAEFPGTSLREAGILLGLWINNFSEEGNYETIIFTKTKPNV